LPVDNGAVDSLSDSGLMMEVEDREISGEDREISIGGRRDVLINSNNKAKGSVWKKMKMRILWKGMEFCPVAQTNPRPDPV